MRLAVLGDPVAHSLSPALHGAALRELGIPGEYVAIRVDEDGLGRAVDDLRHGRLDGANVTMPHKALAANLCDERSEAARRTGAVNTLTRLGTSVVGHNTDVDGVRHAWNWGGLPTGTPVLVLGAGGAAAAALVASGPADLHLASRDPVRAAALVEGVAAAASVIHWGEAVAGAVVVNATPVGMRGEQLPEGVLASACGLLDMAYGPAPTPAITEAIERGLPHADGQMMLLGQAVESFRLWTGREAPVEAMRRAMTRARESVA